MIKTYYEKLKDPRWQRKRLEVLQRTDFHCEVCGDGESTLHVHHKVYFKGREPWDYDAEQLTALCENCHAIQHDCDDPYELVGSYLPIDGPGCRDNAAALAIGFGASMDAANKVYEILGWVDDAPFAYKLEEIGTLARVIQLHAHDVEDDFYRELAWAIRENPQAFIAAARQFVESVSVGRKYHA